VGGRIALTQAAQHNRTTAHHMGSPQSTTGPNHAGYAIYDSPGRKRSMKDTQKPASSTTGRASKGFTGEERAAMKEHARGLKAAARRGPRAGKADGESELLAKIAEMTEPDRAMAGRLHALIKASAPTLAPRTWYGMPAYAKDGKVVCFFQSGQKFKTRYATLGFSDAANLDDGAMWATAFALTELTAAEEARIGALVKKAVS
jgi:uncharacterized protein YdhG (YjbR/CyaY superfamily)